MHIDETPATAAPNTPPPTHGNPWSMPASITKEQPKQIIASLPGKAEQQAGRLQTLALKQWEEELHIKVAKIEELLSSQEAIHKQKQAALNQQSAELQQRAEVLQHQETLYKQNQASLNQQRAALQRWQEVQQEKVAKIESLVTTKEAIYQQQEKKLAQQHAKLQHWEQALGDKAAQLETQIQQANHDNAAQQTATKKAAEQQIEQHDQQKRALQRREEVLILKETQLAKIEEQIATRTAIQKKNQETLNQQNAALRRREEAILAKTKSAKTPTQAPNQKKTQRQPNRAAQSQGHAPTQAKQAKKSPQSKQPFMVQPPIISGQRGGPQTGWKMNNNRLILILVCGLSTLFAFGPDITWYLSKWYPEDFKEIPIGTPSTEENLTLTASQLTLISKPQNATPAPILGRTPGTPTTETHNHTASQNVTPPVTLTATSGRKDNEKTEHSTSQEPAKPYESPLKAVLKRELEILQKQQLEQLKQEQQKRQQHEKRQRAEQARQQEETRLAEAKEQAQKQEETRLAEAKEQARQQEAAARTAKTKEPSAIQTLLAAVDQDIKADRLSRPKNNNAITKLQTILTLHPGHAGAQQALMRVAERYVALAKRAVSKKAWKKSRRFLNKAQEVYPQLETIEPVRAMLPAKQRRR